MKPTTRTIVIIVLVIAIIIITAKKLTMQTWDHYTNDRLKQLHPQIRASVIAFINELDNKHGIKVRITGDGHFRSFEEQDAIYAKGRTAPGKIVTWAKAGQSYHNYGLAIDIVEISGSKALWTNPNWELIGTVGEKHGFEWGGRWTGNKTDRPHFQKTFGHSTSELLARHKAGLFNKNGYLKRIRQKIIV